MQPGVQDVLGESEEERHPSGRNYDRQRFLGRMEQLRRENSKLERDLSAAREKLVSARRDASTLLAQQDQVSPHLWGCFLPGCFLP